VAGEEKEEVVLKKASMRANFLIWAGMNAAELLLLVCVVVGVGFGRAFGGDAALPMILGGVVGFVISAPLAGCIFLLSEIERNTRHSALMFERLATRGRQ
jgi:phosphotransferase system  glucose/maltose/N-acetylglucosamine-specific IIC component